MPTTPPGWYPDPQDTTWERRWTGAEWTTDTRRAPQPVTRLNPATTTNPISWEQQQHTIFQQAAEQRSYEQAKREGRAASTSWAERLLSNLHVGGNDDETWTKFIGFVNNGRAAGTTAEPFKDTPQTAKRAIRKHWFSIGLAAVLLVPVIYTISLTGLTGLTGLAGLDTGTGTGTGTEGFNGNWVIGIVLLLAVLGVIAVRAWQRYWRIIDTPSLNLGALRPGLVELAGTVTAATENGSHETALTGIEAIWSTTHWDEETRDSEGNKSWSTIRSHEFGSDTIGITDGRYTVALPGYTQQATRRVATYEFSNGTHRIRERAAVVGDPLTVHCRVIDQGNGPAVAAYTPYDRFTFANVGSTHSVATKLRRRALAASATVFAITVMLTATLFAVVEGNPWPGVTVATLIVGTVAAVAYMWRLHNRIASLVAQQDAGFAQIKVETTRRHQLIDNLYAVVAATMAHEQAVIDNLTRLRTRQHMAASTGTDTFDQAATTDRHVAGELFAVAEAYPALKSAAAQALFAELAATEDKIAGAREYFNDAVTVHRDVIGTFPGLIYRGMFAAPLPLLNLGLDPETARPATANHTP